VVEKAAAEMAAAEMAAAEMAVAAGEMPEAVTTITDGSTTTHTPKAA
jgi:hypothetical protein